jgi:hypothetical protein
VTGAEARKQRQQWRRRVLRLPDSGYRRWLLLVGSDERARAADDGTYWLPRADAADVLGVDESTIKRYRDKAKTEGWLMVVEKGHRGRHQVYALSVPGHEMGGELGGEDCALDDPLCAPSKDRTTHLREEPLPTATDDLRRWVHDLSRDLDVPRYGSAEWFEALAADDPVWIVAALHFAEWWRAECDEDLLKQRVRDELTAMRAAEAALEEAAFSEVAARVRSCADKKPWREIWTA